MNTILEAAKHLASQLGPTLAYSYYEDEAKAKLMAEAMTIVTSTDWQVELSEPNKYWIRLTV